MVKRRALFQEDRLAGSRFVSLLVTGGTRYWQFSYSRGLSSNSCSFSSIVKKALLRDREQEVESAYDPER